MKKKLLLVSMCFSFYSVSLHAELVHQFKSPSFNGQGWSSHVLTVDSIEKSRRDAIEADRKAESARLAADALNTPLNRFFNLFQSQVYSQLATQLSNNLFQNNCKTATGAAISGCVPQTTGTFSLDGNTVTWARTDNQVTLTVVDANGTVTTVKVPIASFAF